MALNNHAIDEMKTFLNKTFCVPNYQREYSWGKDELQDFWSDLMDTVNNVEDVHFFGQIVVHDDQDHKRKYIIDGQQRTTTSMIFLRALQIFYEKLYETSKIKNADYKRADIESIYLGREGEYHLTLGESDNDYFVQHILANIDVDKKCKKKSNENIRYAYLFFAEHIGKLIDNLDDEEKNTYLDKLLNSFIQRFKVLYMEATRLEEAFVIFETLNARGKELETADLLKNYLLNQSKDIDASIKSWNSMISKLDKVDPTKYIRYYWNATHSFTRDKALYRTIANSIKSPKKCKEFLADLELLAAACHDLVVPSEPTFFIASEDEKIRESLSALKTLKATTFYPIVLATILAFPKDYKPVVEAELGVIENYVFRNATICGNTSNTTETFFAEIAKKIYEEEITKTSEICGEIKKGYVSETEFIDSFKIYSGSKTTKETVRYIFRKIHKYLDKNLELNLNNSEVHIEHIMPEDPSQWNVTQDFHETYLWRLGNLALLSGPINISISNKPFDEKKDGYLDSAIKPNKDIPNYLVKDPNDDSALIWGQGSIENRQIKLAEYAKAIWS